MNYKQAILVRQDLKLPKGKLAAQVAHASLETVMKVNKRIVRAWRADGMGKVVLKVKNLAALRKYVNKAKRLSITTCMISDAGRTVVKPGTITCAGIGPDKTEMIDRVVSELKLV